jgi:hypothetical protein
MKSSVPTLVRALTLGLTCGVAACDIASFIQDPKPILEQTWVVPAESASISVASILPNGIGITPDSSAFQVSLSAVNFTRRVGDDCAACQTANGTTAIKPSFVLATGSSTSMASEVVSGALVGGLVNIQVTNNLSFDPLRVKTIAPASTNPAQQGRMVIVIRSGSLVVGKDSVNGVTTLFAPGTILTRPITLQTGNISGTLSVDLTLTSPASDNNVFINANGTLSASASVPDLRIAQIRMNVVNQSLANVAADSIELSGLDESITDHVIGAGMEMTITNPFNVVGNLTVSLGYAPSQSITKSVTLPSGVAQSVTISLDSAEMASLFTADDKVALAVSGTVNSTAPIDVTPKQAIIIASKLRLSTRFGGGN